MIVEARTVKQAALIAVATGGTHLPGKKPPKLSRRVQIAGGFEPQREAVESVTVLFKLFDDDEMQVPSGWVITGAEFEVEWPKDRSVIHSHFAARRFAYNWARRQVAADLDAKKADPEHESAPWSLPAL